MSRKNLEILLALTTMTDLLIVSCSWIAAFYLRFYTFLPIPKGVPAFTLYLKLLPFVVLIWFFTLRLSGLYTRFLKRRSRLFELFDICQSCFLATLVFIVVTYLYHEYYYSRLNLLIFSLIHPVLLLVGRTLIRKGLSYYRKRTIKRRLLIICSPGNLSDAICVSKEAYLEHSVVTAMVWVDPPSDTETKIVDQLKHKPEILAVPSDWALFFIEHPCDSVVFSLAQQKQDFLDEHLESIAEQVNDIKIIPDLAKLTRFGAGIDMVQKMPVISIHESPLQGFGRASKRILDIVGAGLALLIFAPVMLVIALVIRLSSPGPIFFRQDRLGLDGHGFGIFKFRSMPVGVEKKSGAIWASSGDDRATSFGAFIRRSSLDELPQLFNVIRGDMSLVGPRPERPVFVNRFRQEVPGYMLRHKVKAGMTGWAQINGWRGNTSISKRIECDLFYIQNWSLWFDIKILFLTVLRGFVHPNAY